MYVADECVNYICITTILYLNSSNSKKPGNDQHDTSPSTNMWSILRQN